MTNRVFIRPESSELRNAIASLDVPPGESRDAIAARVAGALPVFTQHAPWMLPLPPVVGEPIIVAEALRLHAAGKINRRRTSEAEAMLSVLADPDGFVTERRAAGDHPAEAVVRVLDFVRSTIGPVPSECILPIEPRVPAGCRTADPLPASLVQSVEDHRRHVAAIRAAIRTAALEDARPARSVRNRREWRKPTDGAETVPVSMKHAAVKWFGRKDADDLKRFLDAGIFAAIRVGKRVVFDLDEVLDKPEVKDSADPNSELNAAKRAAEAVAEAAAAEKEAADARERMRRLRAKRRPEQGAN